MTCETCQNKTWHQNASGEMRKQGFCGCAKQPAYVYMSRLFERECADYLPKAAV